MHALPERAEFVLRSFPRGIGFAAPPNVVIVQNLPHGRICAAIGPGNAVFYRQSSAASGYTHFGPSQRSGRETHSPTAPGPLTSRSNGFSIPTTLTGPTWIPDF